MVITSALAKRPEDRFQTAGELSEALAAAAAGQMPDHAVSAAATNPATASNETSRIVVPTDSNEAPRNTRHDERDEETVIRARPAAIAYEDRAPRTRASEPLPPLPPPKSNPWRIIIPALAGLLVLVGVIYAITYRGNPAQPNANQSPGMTADPNSKPVQPAPPPTGNAEQGIAPSVNSNTTNNTGAANANDAGAKPAENKNGEGAAPAENANTGNANRKERGQKNSNNQGEQTDNAQPRQDNQDQGDEPPPPPKSDSNKNSSGDNPSDNPKPKPKKVDPTLPPPPPTSNISQQEQ
jgi:hypothetical protein